MPAYRDRHTRPNALPSVPAEAALSFLKDTKGTLAWTARDLADTLKINRPEAKQILAFLQAQGYVQPARSGEPAQQREPARGTMIGSPLRPAKPSPAPRLPVSPAKVLNRR